MLVKAKWENDARMTLKFAVLWSVKCKACVRNTPDRTTKLSWGFALITFSLERIKNISVLENV